MQIEGSKTPKKREKKVKGRKLELAESMIPKGKVAFRQHQGAKKRERCPHTHESTLSQGTGKPILPPMAESMRGPLKIVPSLKRQHHFTRTMPIPQRAPHFHTPRTPHFRHMSRESAPFAGGWGIGMDHPPPSPVSFFAVFRNQSTH